jgi:hypothetical protein
MDWFRWHHGSVNDPKFQLVAKKAGCSVAEVIAVWACLLEAASMAEERGNPGALDFEALECALGLADGKAGMIYAAMITRGLVADSGEICAWEKRQPKREREDNSAERVKAFRKRHVTPCNASDNHVTPCNASDNQETPRLEEIREEVKAAPLTRPIGLQTYLDRCQAAGVAPIPEGSAVFVFADRAGIPQPLVALAWRKFKAKHLESGKRQKDWQQTFGNCVRDNWYKLWYVENGAAIETREASNARVMYGEAA